MSGCGVDVLQEIASLERENEGVIDEPKGLKGLEQELNSFEEDRGGLSMSVWYAVRICC